MGWRLFLDGFGLAGHIMSGLVLGLNGNAAAEYICTVRRVSHVQMKNVECASGRKHRRQICSMLNLAILQGNTA